MPQASNPSTITPSPALHGSANSPKTKRLRPILIIIASLAILLIILVIFFLFRSKINVGSNKGKDITLRIFYIGERSESFDEANKEFSKKNPNSKIEIIKNSDNLAYRDQLALDLAAKKQIDIFMIDNGWLEKFKNLAAAPSPDQLKSVKANLGNTCPAVAARIINPQLGVSLDCDNLAMYYNTDILDNGNVPQTWNDVKALAASLTTQSQNQIVRSGVALGTSTNINNSTDILLSMMIQNHTVFYDSDNQTATFNRISTGSAGQTTTPGLFALDLYTSFAFPTSPNRSWSGDLDNAINAFSKSKTAVYFDYSSARQKLRDLNPKLNYKIASYPQIKDDDPANIAFYHPFLVNTNSAHPKEAWDYLVALTSSASRQSYLEINDQPSAVIDQKINDDLSVFDAQKNTAKEYNLIDSAKIDAIFKGTITDVISGKSASDPALNQAAEKVTQVKL